MQRITKELARFGHERSKIEFLIRSICNTEAEQAVSGKARNAENVELIECKRWKDNDVLFYNTDDKGLIVLNRPKSLNAIRISMCNKMMTILKEWESSKKLVILKGAGGRSFCCGGDLGTMRSVRPDNYISAAIFLNTAYKLYHYLGRYKVPAVALMDNITMGGGAGLSIHGKYKVITERSIFAMPETAIGFFPDAGCSYVFPRLQGYLGLFLGLTGYRLKGIDIVHAGIATHYVHADKIQDLEQELLSSDNTNFDEILEKYRANSDGLEFGLSPYIEKINACFSADSVEEIIERLQNDGSEWSKMVIKTLDKMSPTALKVTHEMQRKGKNLSFTDCIKMENRLAHSFICAYSDFYEGSRTIPNKLKEPPNWYPKSLREVTSEDVLKRFTFPSPELEL